MHPRGLCILLSSPRSVRRARRVFCAALLAFAISSGCAQTPAHPWSQSEPAASAIPAAIPIFDVAAIHPHTPEPHEHNSIWSSPLDGRFKAANVSVLMLIHWAWEMPETRILGAPAWAGSAYFNIDAVADPSLDKQLAGLPADAARKLKQQMVRALLADRFKLAAHIETRKLPIYALVVARGGPKLGPLQDHGSSVSSGTGHIDVQTSDSVAGLAEELSKVAGRDVVDRTGIAGRYHLILSWTPDEYPPSAADPGPSLFTALEEQLGLKLEPQKGPVQVLLIDHVELPSEN
jgi:uncharacterized protein (TIGR03435 family)